MDQKRTPKGASGAGQFAATAHAEPALTLSAGTPELGIRDRGDMFSAARDLLRNAVQSHRDRIEARRADCTPRSRPDAMKRRIAVAALVLAASMSMTACTGQNEECPSAADFPSSSNSLSADASIMTVGFPMKGGGHGGGHGSGHGASGTSEGGGSAGGSSGSSGPHFWPWTSSSHSNQCDAHPTTTPAP